MLTSLLAAVVLTPAFPAAVGTLVYVTLIAPRPVPRRVSGVLLPVLAVAGAVGLAVGVYRSYAVPRDVMQDVIAAREYLAGRPMHPAHMNELMRDALAGEAPRRSLLAGWPAAAVVEQAQRETALREHWVQAHPPVMTLAVAPLVAAFGILGTQAAVSLLSAVALGATLWLLRRELWPGARGALPLAVVLAVIGWAPVIGVFRLQQPGLILVGLLTAAWACLRRGYGAMSGPFVAVAAGLKLVPGLLVVPLVVRHRRAAVLAVLTGVVLLAGVFALVPVADIEDYRETAAEVAEEYATYPAMVSVLGVYARWGRAAGAPPGVARVLWLATVLGVVAAWGGVLLLPPRAGADPPREVDFEFAVGMSLIPWLSPIAWDHYQVFLLLPLAVLGVHVFRAGASRNSRVVFAGVLVAVSIPDALFLAAFDLCRESGLRSLQLCVLEPVRAFVGVFLTAFLVRAWRCRSGTHAGAARGEPGREERIVTPGVAA